MQLDFDFKKEKGKHGSSQKATDDELTFVYSKTGSVWKTAKAFGMCGQSVHERLTKIGIQTKMNIFTESDYNILLNEYVYYRELGILDVLAAKMNRTKYFICRKAKELGLTNIKHKKPYAKGVKRPDISERWMTKGHPKGMLGKFHTQKTKDDISKKVLIFQSKFSEEKKNNINIKRLRTRLVKYGSLHTSERIKTTWRGGWRTIGGKRKYYRSSWEANYARYLQFLKDNNKIKKWLHEPEVFWFNKKTINVYCYIPDFKVVLNDSNIEYHEVKGWMDGRSKQKINGFRSEYPEHKLLIIDKYWFRKNKDIKNTISEWEEQVC